MSLCHSVATVSASHSQSRLGTLLSIRKGAVKINGRVYFLILAQKGVLLRATESHGQAINASCYKSTQGLKVQIRRCICSLEQFEFVRAFNRWTYFSRTKSGIMKLFRSLTILHHSHFSEGSYRISCKTAYGCLGLSSILSTLQE
jgi:hypothetical protein